MGYDNTFIVGIATVLGTVGLFHSIRLALFLGIHETAGTFVSAHL
jgi:hypothetical protein